MFETAELGHTIDKATYAKRVPALRLALLDAQHEVLKAARFPVLLIVGGVDGAGKGETVNVLLSWMDPRYISTWAMGPRSAEEHNKPPYFRFWQVLPPKGRLGILFGSWHSEAIVQRAHGDIDLATFDQRLDEVVRFERMLTDEGALIVKFWMHLSKKQQKKRLESLEADKATRWRVTPSDWKSFALYDRYRKASEHALMRTSTGNAPWIVVEGSDARYRSLTVGTALLRAVRTRLAGKAEPYPKSAAPLVAPVDGRSLLATLDLSKKTPAKAYDAQLTELQGRLAQATRSPRFRERAIVLVFEGADAAGKGGAIRHVTSGLDARCYSVIPIAAPTEEERAQPYLWRFWRHVPSLGRIAIFDRSWYGRVLVERVEGFADESAWMRAYAEMSDFEAQLTAHGIVVLKFWLQIDAEEQLRRFKERERTKFKRFKITQEDWRNRKKWDAYQLAASDMIERTSVDAAPWTMVEANDKDFARLKVLETICDRVERAIGRK
jgi:polyphosphate:AMP phosphotransferase